MPRGRQTGRPRGRPPQLGPGGAQRFHCHHLVRAHRNPRPGHADRPYALIEALEKVKADLEAAFGTWRVPWGDVNRLQRVHTSGTQEPFRDDRPSVPVPGAPSFTGTIFTFGTREAPGQKRMYGTVGDTYVSVVEFGKNPRRIPSWSSAKAPTRIAPLLRSGRAVLHPALQARLVHPPRNQTPPREKIPSLILNSS